jgi:quercetin dioxygenase-like cupin family protein
MRRTVAMIVRNTEDPDVKQTTYAAHGGGVARMLLTSRFMEAIEFLAHAWVPAGRTLEEHVDPVEEIYYILKGGGIMQVDDERREVFPGDAVWIPAGAGHSLVNNTDQVTEILVVAAYPVCR